MKDSVLLDTSFFIRLLNDKDPLHDNAKGYYRYYLEKDIFMKVSTISIAEYCVLGQLNELPLRNIQILPFNLNHSVRTGEFAKIIFQEKKITKKQILPRAIIPNDSKLFAQADLDENITHFVTSDSRSKNNLNLLKRGTNPKFEIIDISIPHHQFFGLLDL